MDIDKIINIVKSLLEQAVMGAPTYAVVTGQIAVTKEAGDVMCMIQLLVEKDLVNQAELNKRIVEKREKLKTFSTLTNL